MANMRHVNAILKGKLEAETNRRLRAEEKVRICRKALVEIVEVFFTEHQMETAAMTALAATEDTNGLDQG